MSTRAKCVSPGVRLRTVSHKRMASLENICEEAEVGI